MAEPLIKKAGFWADGINGLLLRKPYRTYTKKNAAPAKEQQDSPYTVPAFKEREMDTVLLTRMLDEHWKAIQKIHPNAKPEPRHAKPVGTLEALDGSITPPDDFPLKIWERSKVSRMTDELVSSGKVFPEYILKALEPSTFAAERLKIYDFGITEAAIVASAVRGIDMPAISTSLQVSQEYISGILNRAYETFGVETTAGLQVAFSWLASVEAENVAHTLREEYETAIKTGTPEQQGDRPTVSHGPEPEPEERLRKFKE